MTTHRRAVTKVAEPIIPPQSPEAEVSVLGAILQDPKLPLLRFYGNSAFVAVANVLTNLLTSSLLGFLFAKYEFQGKRLLFGWFLLTMMIPGTMTMIPGYLILARVGLLNTLWGLVVFSGLNAFGIFMMRQFLETFPNELLDAARVDGASEWQVFGRIVLPQLGPAMATLGTLTFPTIFTVPLGLLVIIVVSLLDPAVPTNVNEIWLRIHGTADTRLRRTLQPAQTTT